MSQPSADSTTLTEDQLLASVQGTIQLCTSIAHRWLALVGCAFAIFGFVFLQLYSDNFWFSLNVLPLGIPAIVGCGALSSVLLYLCDTKLTYKLVQVVWKGKPPVVFRKWVEIDPDGLTYGLRHVQWSAIDELRLTWFGNLEIRSHALAGPKRNADVILKFPFGCASQATQNRFVELVRSECPNVSINQRLEKQVSSPIVKGQNVMQAVSAVLMTAILFDVGFSCAYYLEMLKHYYLAEKTALAGSIDQGTAELAQGDDLQKHPLPVSYVTTCLVKSKFSAADLAETRARALWALGRKDEAVSDMRRAIEFTPAAFRLYLHLARYLVASGHVPQAKQAISDAIDHRKNSLLPRLYMLAVVKDTKPEQVENYYKQMLADLDENTYQEDGPVWPPGGSRVVDYFFYRDDLTFVFGKLFGRSP